MRLLGVALALAVTGLLIWGVQSVPDSSVGSPGGVIRITKTIVVYPNLETFAPARPSIKPTLTFNQAFSRYAKDQGARRVTHPLVPGTEYLGLVTIGSGKHYRARDELAYAFVTSAPCVYHGPLSTPPPQRTCDEWLVLDANTGGFLDDLHFPRP